MEYFRRELLPCVWLTALRTDQFKTGVLSARLLTQLDRENAAQNAVLPHVLRRGTTALPDTRSMDEYLDNLYGASVSSSTRKLGEIHAVGFFADFIDDRFLPDDEAVLPRIVDLMGQLWLSPNTRGGLFLPDYVESERGKLVDRLEAMRSNRRAWAVRQLTEKMCAFEDYAVSVSGSVEEANNIHYVKLTRHYRSLLASSPMEIFYCGSRSGQEVADMLSEALLLLPRGEIDLDLGTDVRMNAVEAEPRYFTEEMDVTQGVLAMGFRLGECMNDPDEAAISVFDAVFGGCASSKLFRNVREKRSLCYYASSTTDLHKGIMRVASAIDFDKYDEARSEILAQLDAMRRGEITEEELDAARTSVISSLRCIPDNPDALESFYLDRAVMGTDASPDDIAALVESVTAESVAEIARGVELDAVYFLRGEGV